MPIGREVTYKCKKCGYVFTKFRGDVVNLDDFIVKCPRCGGDVELYDKGFIKKIFDFFKKD